MGSNGYSTITLVDGGGAAIVVPNTQVQVVMGVSSTATVGTITATKSPSVLASTFGWGPLPEAASLTCLAGGTVLAIPPPQHTPTAPPPGLPSPHLGAAGGGARA